MICSEIGGQQIARRKTEPIDNPEVGRKLSGDFQYRIPIYRGDPDIRLPECIQKSRAQTTRMSDVEGEDGSRNSREKAQKAQKKGEEIPEAPLVTNATLLVKLFCM
jgi:hypothetical protein